MHEIDIAIAEQAYNMTLYRITKLRGLNYGLGLMAECVDWRKLARETLDEAYREAVEQACLDRQF